jgi:hypothetical protein
MTARRVAFVLLIAILHFATVTACAVLALRTYDRWLSLLGLFLYLGLSLPVLLYRTFSSQPLSLDLLSWWAETPINSIIYSVLVALAWKRFERRRTPHTHRYVILSVALAVSALIGWCLNKEVW